MLQNCISKHKLKFLRAFSSGKPVNKNPDSYIPPKPKEFRKVVREKDTYLRGEYEIDKTGMKVLEKGPIATDKDGAKWFSVYNLP